MLYFTANLRGIYVLRLICYCIPACINLPLLDKHPYFWGVTASSVFLSTSLYFC